MNNPREGRGRTLLRFIASVTGLLLLGKSALTLYNRWKDPSPGRIQLDTPQAHNPPDKVTAEEMGQVQGRPARLPDPEDLAAGYELSDMTVRGGLTLFIVVIVATALAFAAVTGYQALRTGTIGDFTPPPDGVAVDPEGPIPEVIESRARSGLEYAEMRDSQNELLNSYGWVDEEAGVVHLPIDRAMDLMLERGAFPSRDSEEASRFRDTGLELPLDSSSGRELERKIDP